MEVRILPSSTDQANKVLELIDGSGKASSIPGVAALGCLHSMAPCMLPNKGSESSVKTDVTNYPKSVSRGVAMQAISKQPSVLGNMEEGILSPFPDLSMASLGEIKQPTLPPRLEGGSSLGSENCRESEARKRQGHFFFLLINMY